MSSRLQGLDQPSKRREAGRLLASAGYDFAARAGFSALFQGYSKGAGPDRFELGIVLYDPSLGLISSWG